MASRDTEEGEQELTAAQAKTRAQYEAENHLVLRDLLRTYAGRQYLWRVLTRCGIFCMSFKPGEADTTSFNEGKRNVGLSIFNDVMGVDQKAFAQMQAEGSERERKFQEELSRGAE